MHMFEACAQTDKKTVTSYNTRGEGYKKVSIKKNKKKKKNKFVGFFSGIFQWCCGYVIMDLCFFVSCTDSLSLRWRFSAMVVQLELKYK